MTASPMSIPIPMPASVPIKTAEGRAELSARPRRLSQRQRTVLFLVDGKRSAMEVRRMAVQAGVDETCFDELVAAGLIELQGAQAAATPTAPQHVDLPLPGPDSVIDATPESLLPPSRSLAPESASLPLVSGPGRVVSAWQSLTSAEANRTEEADDADAADPAFAEARAILLRAVRAEAPLAGSLTLRRLRRARNREELMGLLDEVEARIAKPHRALTTQQTMRRVRLLLGSQPSSLLDFA